MQQLRSQSSAALLAKEVAVDDLPDDPVTWSLEHVEQWLKQNGLSDYTEGFKIHKIDGAVLMTMTEEDLVRYIKVSALGDIKRIAAKIELVKQGFHGNEIIWWDEPLLDVICKFVFSAIYCFGVFALTAVVMTYVHDRIPDPIKYPPLPDILLDNLPVIPEAFQLAETLIAALMGILAIVILLHKHRFVLLRRLCAIAGACFLLRCLTMFATSLSVPAHHLKCEVKTPNVEERMQQAWRILSGVGASLTGVRTCGDYMFSGHTTLLTLISYFLLEYTPATWEGLHMVIRFCNYFGMLLVLLAHEHYTIDVTIAYAFSSRLFLYYHSMANQRPISNNHISSHHTRSFIPLFNYLERQTVARVPNIYDFPLLFLWRAFSRKWYGTNGTNNHQHKHAHPPAHGHATPPQVLMNRRTSKSDTTQ